MMPVRQLDIAVVADEDLVSILRLAGVSRYHIVRDGPGRGEDIRKSLGALLQEPDIGLVVIPDDYREYVADLLAAVRGGKRATPVIIEVPSRYEPTYRDAREYYTATIRKFIGFDIEVY
jgi:vacuolar-type H+-ATPase subunit F/Vma7